MGIANITNNILTDSGILTSSLQNSITLTTNGFVGVSTFSGNVLNIPNYGAISDGVVSGGIVTWTGTGLIFTVSACNYYINDVNYNSPLTTITLDPADPSFDRIDVFSVNTSSQVVVIKGTPALNPVEPEGDTNTTLGLTNVTVTAGSTTPNQAIRNLIYDENVESWTQAITGGIGFSYNNVDTTQSYTPTKSFKVIQGTQFAQLRFSKAISMDVRDYKSLSFAIRLNAAWTTQQFQVSFYNGSTRTALYSITSTNTVGFNRALANQWQFLTINLALFTFSSNAFTSVQIYTSGSNTTYWIDTVSLNGGITSPVGPSVTSITALSPLTGGTITSSGSIGISQSSATTNGYLSSTDWNTFNGKQPQLNGTGFVKAVGTVISYDNSTYLTANESITLSGAVTGTGTTAITTTLANSIVGIANLSATGTPSATTYLRGDNTWATVGGGMAIGGSITSATAGSVLFAGTSGVLQEDNANFFWNDATNRLGIGTSSPTAPLSVGASRLLLFSDTPTNAAVTTKMGYMFSTIGTAGSTPSGSFVEDTAAGTILSYGVNIGQAGTRNTAYVGGIFRLDTRATEQKFVVHGYPTGGSVENERISVNLQTGATYLNGVAGNTGIGYASSTSLTFKLDVNGTGRYTGALTITAANNAATGAGQLYLNGATGNRIEFNTNGNGAPTFTTRSVGTKIVLFPAVGASAVDYGLGIEGNTMWFSVPDTISSNIFKWYAGTTNILTLTGAGAMTLSRDQNAGTNITVSNTTSGAAAQTYLQLTSDASSGLASFGKYSTTMTPNKIIAAKDTFLYNYVTAGDIAILNDFASGTIKMAAGGSSVSHLVVKTTGQLQLNNYTSTSAFTGTAVGYLGFDASGNILSSAVPASSTVTFNRIAGSYTLVLADASKMVEMNSAGANNLIVPLNGSVAFPIGTNIDITQYGAGQTTVVATGGVTIRSTGARLKIFGQYSAATLIKVGTDEWYLFGDLTL